MIGKNSIKTLQTNDTIAKSAKSASHMKRYFKGPGGVAQGALETGDLFSWHNAVMTLRSVMLPVILLALVAAPAWGASFTGQLVRAEGIRALSESADGQVIALDHFESFTFVLDSNGREYDLVKYEGKLPHRSTRGTLTGVKIDVSTIAVESFTEAQAVSGTPTPLPQTKSILSVKVNLDGSWQETPSDPPVVFTLEDNPLSEETVRYHFWERQWNVQQYFDTVTRNQYTFVNSLDGDSVPDFAEVTLTPESDPCGNGQFQNPASCSQIRTAVNCALSGGAHDPANYDHRVYIGPDKWGCGIGLGTVGPSSFLFVALGASLTKGLTGVLHEIGHNIGFEHSNARDGTNGDFQEYGDKSSMMGFSSYADYYWRKGFNAVQLFRLGVIDDSRTLVVPTVADNIGGELYSTYFQETSGAVKKLVKLGSSGYFLAYRSPVDQTVDHQADRSANTYVAAVPTYTGRLMVYYLEPLSNGELRRNMVTLVGSVGVGETQQFGGFTIRADWQNHDMLHFSVGPSPAAAPPRPSDIVSAGTIVAVVDSVDPTDAQTTQTTATCQQLTDVIFCDANLNELQLSAGGTVADSFVRLKINVPQGTAVNSASLGLDVSWLSDVEFAGGDGSMTMRVQVEDTDNSAPLVNYSNVRARSFTLAQSTTFTVPLHFGDDLSLNITNLVQAMVNRPGWTAGNYVLFGIRRTAGSENLTFLSAKANVRSDVAYFASPRAIITVGQKADEIFKNGFEQ
jgi:hypothetical protein